MVQIYFLLILSNLIMGIILAKNYLNSKIETFSSINQLLSSEILQVTIGCIGTIVGLLALFLRFDGNMIILGDIIPAGIAIISGITLFIEYIAQEEENDSVIINSIKKVFLKNRTILGFSGIIVAILHFIIPGIELL
ncbi:MAG: hypothetical protein B6229_00140 [Spirochaetaceae bacterium 4572_7]|nr:MAG: hypothetical protein B6229_00140 [Spirochaetaceae bacterium 4572_7]